jgi:hypothetical protein
MYLVSLGGDQPPTQIKQIKISADTYYIIKHDMKRWQRDYIHYVLRYEVTTEQMIRLYFRTAKYSDADCEPAP